MRIDRLLAITMLMLNKNRVTARELAEKFEVSVRTIYRDLDALLLAGIPVMSYQGNDGGYGLVENYKIDRQFLSLKDMLSILSALQSINISLEDNQLDSAMEKIKSLVPKDKKEEMDMYMEQIVLDVLPWGSGERQGSNLKEIHKAIVSCKIIKFTYTNTHGEKITRSVEPMTLFFKGYGWYLFAYCLKREEYRVFRLTRIKNLSILEIEFTRRKKSYRDMEQPDFRDKQQLKIAVRFSHRVRVWVEDSFHDDEIEILNNGDILATTMMSDENWLYPWILSFGENAEVIEPAHIRKKILEIAKKIQKKYQT